MSDEALVQEFDAVVIGLGVYGSAVAYELATRGLRVLGVERSQERAVLGASQGPVRMVRGGTAVDGAWAGLAREAGAWWQGFARERGPGLFRPAGELSSPHATGPTSDNGSPSWTGLLDAAGCVRELRHRAARVGATLWFGCEAEVESAAGTGNGTDVRAGDHRVRADMVVSAVGASLRLGPSWLVPQGVTIERAPMQIGTWPLPAFPPDVFYVLDDDGDDFCVVPIGTSAQLQFGHFGPPPGAAVAADETADRAARARDYAALLRFFPALDRPVDVCSVRAAYVFHPVSDFVLTWVRPQVAVVTACAGIGFKFAPILAPRIADLVVRAGAGGGQTELLAVNSEDVAKWKSISS